MTITLFKGLMCNPSHLSKEFCVNYHIYQRTFEISIKIRSQLFRIIFFLFVLSPLLIKNKKSRSENCGINLSL